jgi:hypothetical protein
MPYVTDNLLNLKEVWRMAIQRGAGGQAMG